MQSDTEDIECYDSMSHYVDLSSQANTLETQDRGKDHVSTALVSSGISDQESQGQECKILTASTDENSFVDSFDEHTQSYSLARDESEFTPEPVQYTDADFESVDDESDYSFEDTNDCIEEEESTNYMADSVNKYNNSEQKDISDNSSDENMEKSSPWKQVKPKVKSYKQTTLNFGQGAEAVTSTRAKGYEDSSSSGTSRNTHSLGKKPTGSSRKSFFKHMGDKDTENYRLGYPGQTDNLKLNANLRFYKGEVSSFPDGAFIDEMHNDWWGHYELLERHHGYIQWLFPIREEGMNWQAQALQRHEAKDILADYEAHNRVMLSYEMMLDFFGMKLEDRRTGQLGRSRNWRERYQNLKYSSHNYLRITRMLKSLGEFELEHLKKPFLEFILSEIFQHGQLKRTLNSLQNYWIGTIKDDDDREHLHRYVEELTQ